MRKIVSFTHVSLDGFVCGLNGELAWVNIGDEIYADVEPRLQKIGAAIYGRVTYGMMAGYWQTVPSNPDSSARDKAHAAWVEAIPKVVVSRSLEQVDWNNTSLIKDHVAQEIGKLKQQAGGDLMIFGSPKLTHLLAGLGLVDEYLMYLNPVVIGAGTPLFEAGGKPSTLKLLEEKQFNAGVIVLRYALDRSV
jgi:dihydrofolate reductase